MKTSRILAIYLISLGMEQYILAQNLKQMTPKLGLNVTENILSHLTVKERENISLSCDIPVENGTECYWSFRGAAVSSENYPIDESCNLNIIEANYMRDNGDWKCTSNSEPFQMKTIMLSVLVPPEYAHLSFNGNRSEEVIVRNQKEVLISCTTANANPPSTLSMTVIPVNDSDTLAKDLVYSVFQNVIVETEDENKLGLFKSIGIVNITNINNYVNELVVTCSVGHSAWGNAIMTNNITVIQQYETTQVSIDGEEEIFAEEGKTVHIECKANGNPKPTYHWKHLKDSNNWSNLEETSNQLSVLVSSDTVGKYSCGAGNDLNTGGPVMAEKMVQVVLDNKLINDSVVPSRLDLSIVKPTSLEVKNGKVNLTVNTTDVILSCSVAHSNPPASLSWSITTRGRKDCNASLDHDTNFHVEKNEEGTTSRTESELHLHFRDGFVEEVKADCQVIAPKGDKHLVQSVILISQDGSSADKSHFTIGWLTVLAILFIRFQ